MDGFEFNKIAGALLATALGVMALGIVAEIVYAPAEAAKPGYAIATAETTEPGTEGPVIAEVAPIAVRLQTADADAGLKVAGKCKSCHTFEKGGSRQTGPNLYGVLGGPAAHMEGFRYSDAMTARRASGALWTYEDLDKFLTSPRGYLPRTAMIFPGLPKPGDRANVIAYLRTLSDSPVPLPAATAEAPAAPEPAPAPPPPEPAPAQ